MIVSREAIRLWVNRFGGHFADCIKRDRPSAADKWHLDEVVIPISGVKHWLCRAIDANGDVYDILLQPRRNARAAKRFLKRLIARFDAPRVVITDKLRSYFKPIRDLAPDTDHRAHKGLNNRIEGSHRPARKREKLMVRFKSPRQAQRLLAAHDQINIVFCPRHYRMSANVYRQTRSDAFPRAAPRTSRMRRFSFRFSLQIYSARFTFGQARRPGQRAPHCSFCEEPGNQASRGCTSLVQVRPGIVAGPVLLRFAHTLLALVSIAPNIVVFRVIRASPAHFCGSRHPDDFNVKL